MPRTEVLEISSWFEGFNTHGILSFGVSVFTVWLHIFGVYGLAPHFAAFGSGRGVVLQAEGTGHRSIFSQPMPNTSDICHTGLLLTRRSTMP